MATVYQSRAQLRIITPKLEELVPLPRSVLIRRRGDCGIDGD
jgi:hypothetical protein